jgi:GntR family transcriptional regulator, transcriptional repressor for pyruvate dehydrogenase complex
VSRFWYAIIWHSDRILIRVSIDQPDGSDGPAVFNAIGREARLSDKVTEAILESIASNRLKPGDYLPTERELGEQFGVSRTVIREAVRALGAKGMLEVRGGSGVRIVAVDEKTVRESMRHFVKGSEMDYGKVDEVRRVLEVAAAGLAAERATPEDIEKINETIEQMERSSEDLEATVQSDLAFHRALATSTHNELFLMLHDSMGEMLLEVRRRNLARGAERRRLVVEMHRRIRDAVANHDPEAARRAMIDHLGEVQAGWDQQTR